MFFFNVIIVNYGIYILHFIYFHYINHHKKSLSLWVQAHYNELEEPPDPYICALFVLTINIYDTDIWLTYLLWSFDNDSWGIFYRWQMCRFKECFRLLYCKFWPYCTFQCLTFPKPWTWKSICSCIWGYVNSNYKSITSKYHWILNLEVTFSNLKGLVVGLHLWHWIYGMCFRCLQILYFNSPFCTHNSHSVKFYL